MSRPPQRKYAAPGNKEPLDPWGEVAHEFPEVDDADSPSNRDTYGGALLRLFRALTWRPISTLVYTAGLAYGSLAVYLIGSNQMLSTYSENVRAYNVPDEELIIPPDTLIVTSEGIVLLLVWLVLPPIWFLYERYAMFKSLQQRAIVKDLQEVSLKVWLAFLVTMVLLAKR
jgi:hypothetical protein